MTSNELYAICIDRAENKDEDADLFSVMAQVLEDYGILDKKNKELEQEADWLAEQASLICNCIENCDECRLFLDCQGRDDKEAWREAARKSVKQ